MQGRRVQGGGSVGRVGFTLTELLVVVGLIVVLVSLLVPAVGVARKAARKAVTESTMTVLTSAIQQFRTDNNRMPGYVSQQTLARTSLAQNGFTVMENALLELAGGVVDPATPLDPDRGVIEIELDSDNEFVIDTFAIGSPDGPGYLEGQGNLIQKAENQFQSYNDSDGLPTDDQELMPDVLDAWGSPIALWIRDEFAGSGASFALPHSQSSTAQFYYQANKGYYDTPRQSSSSLLSARNIGARNTQFSMHALLGHPSFPLDTAADIVVPAQPRGDIILHSGGTDNTFFEQNDPSIIRAEYSYDSTVDPSTNTATVDIFNDVIKASS